MLLTNRKSKKLPPLSYWVPGTRAAHYKIRSSQAFPAWRDTTAKYRSDLLRRWFNLCKENEDDLAEILQIEQGKPIREAKGEVAYGSTFLEWFSEECRRINGEVSLCLDLMK